MAIGLAEEVDGIRSELGAPPAAGKVREPVLRALETIAECMRRRETSATLGSAIELVDAELRTGAESIERLASSSCELRHEFYAAAAELMSLGLTHPAPSCIGCSRYRCVQDSIARFHRVCVGMGELQIELRRAVYRHERLHSALSALRAAAGSGPETSADGATASEVLGRIRPFADFTTSTRGFLLSLLHHSPCPSLSRIGLSLLLKRNDPVARQLVAHALGAAPRENHRETLEWMVLADYPLTASELGSVTRWRFNSETAPRRRLHSAIQHVLRSLRA